MLLIVFVLSVVVLINVRPVAAYQKIYIGRDTSLSWIPVFTLYDPPGDSSYGIFTEATTMQTRVELGAGFGGWSVDGGFEGNIGFSKSFYTPDNRLEHCIIAKQYYCTWDVYYIITMYNSYYTCDLVSVSEESQGSGIFGFSEAGNYDLLYNDLSGTSGDYHENVHVCEDCSATYSMSYSWTDLYYVQLGFAFSAKGVSFRAGVKIRTEDSSTLELDYYFKDTQHSIDCSIESNYDIDFSDEPYDVDDIGIWFKGY